MKWWQFHEALEELGALYKYWAISCHIISADRLWEHCLSQWENPHRFDLDMVSGSEFIELLKFVREARGKPLGYFTYLADGDKMTFIFQDDDDAVVFALRC